MTINMAKPTTITDLLIEDLIYHTIIPLLKQVRTNWVNTHEGANDNAKLIGSCNEISAEIRNKLTEYIRQYGPFDYHTVSFELMHGELAHKPFIESRYWSHQHTWLCMTIGKTSVHIDATCGQFKDIVPNIPDWYVSIAAPMWFYWDRKNPLFNGVTAQIDNVTREFAKKHLNRHTGLIEYLQYDVWGRISDRIYKAKCKGVVYEG